MDVSSRLQAIPAQAGPRAAQIVRVIVRETNGADRPRVALSPGDRLVVENRTRRTLRVTPLDFFGSAFERCVLEAGESTVPLAVHGLWFQVALRADGRGFYPLDIYLAPNCVQA